MSVSRDEAFLVTVLVLARQALIDQVQTQTCEHVRDPVCREVSDPIWYQIREELITPLRKQLLDISLDQALQRGEIYRVRK